MAGSVESYKHKAAKAVVVEWLRTAAKAVGYDNYADLAGIGWRVNRGAPCWGVWDEYPIARDPKGHIVGESLVWDETGWERDIARAGNNDCDCDLNEICSHRVIHRAPSYDELRSLGYSPIVILDVAVQHKGCITYGIEIVHRHDVDDQKAALLEEHGGDICVLTVDAEWVLRQVAPPKKWRSLAAYGQGRYRAVG